MKRAWVVAAVAMSVLVLLLGLFASFSIYAAIWWHSDEWLYTGLVTVALAFGAACGAAFLVIVAEDQ